MDQRSWSWYGQVQMAERIRSVFIQPQSHQPDLSICDESQYVMNQKEHHKKKTFRQEYIELLDTFRVDYDERYIFKPFA